MRRPHFKVYGDRAAAQSFLEPLGRSIYSAGIGSISEIFGGDAPFPPAGCIAQAWSVAEVFSRLGISCGAAEQIGVDGCCS